MPPSPTALTYLSNTAAAVALIPTLSGAAFLFSPTSGAKQMNLPSASSTTAPTTNAETLGLVRMYAVRQCVGGLTTLAMWYTGAYRAMGLAGFAGVLLAVADGFVMRKLVGEQEAWKHWGAAPVGLGLSGALVYYTSI